MQIISIPSMETVHIIIFLTLLYLKMFGVQVEVIEFLISITHFVISMVSVFPSLVVEVRQSPSFRFFTKLNILAPLIN